MGDMFSTTTSSVIREDGSLMSTTTTTTTGVAKPSSWFDTARGWITPTGGWLRFWVFVVLIVVILAFALLGGMLGTNNLPTSWSSQGSEFRNDRHIPISSVWTGNLDLTTPAFVFSWLNSTSSTIAYWKGVGFATSWDGAVVAFDEFSGATIWAINICEDVYGMSDITCAPLIALKKYISVATPTVWRGNIILSVRKPADIIVLSQDKGLLVKRRNLDSNVYAEITQSGTQWNDNLYVGTGISNFDAQQDQNTCSFIGQFFRLDLTTEHMDTLWTFNTADIYNNLTAATGFTGMPIMGSSPPISIRSNLVAFTVGNLICRTIALGDCVTFNDFGCDPELFDYQTYETMYDSCYNNAALKTNTAAFNSIVVLNTEDGTLAWTDKLIGERAWELACLKYNSTTPCGENYDGVCDFYNNPTLNCPSEIQSCGEDDTFASDPVYQLHSSGAQTLYVAQNNGIVYAYDFLPKQPSHKFEELERLGRSRSVQLYWARSVRAGGKIGGLAVGADSVYFSIYNVGTNPIPWIYGNNGSGYDYTPCGGWGNIGSVGSNNWGLPRWYKPNPRCNMTYLTDTCYSSGAQLDPQFSGGRSPPTLTNNVLLVTSQDTSRSFETPPWSSNITYCGGYVFALDTWTGAVSSQYMTGEPFGQQGFSGHGRCVYAGNGPNPYYLPAVGHNVYGWCVPQAYRISTDHTTNDGPFN